MKNRPMIDGIQILRGLAALLVIIRHGTKEVDVFSFEIGQFGVDLFFVISGFVIYLTSQNVGFKLFAKKRIIRIVPLYWLISFVTLILAVILSKGETPQLVLNFIYSILFIPHGNLFPTLYVGWTLNFEIWFYIIFGTLILFQADLLKGATIAILSAIVFGLIILSFQDWVITAPTVPLLPITIEFLSGVWIAHYYKRGFNFSFTISFFLIAFSIIWLVLLPNAGAYTLWRPLVWAFPAILIVVALLGMERYVKFKNFKILMLLGNASYATYLIHPLVIRFMIIVHDHFVLKMNNWVMLLILIISSLVFGLVFHLSIEKWIQNYFTNKYIKVN